MAVESATYINDLNISYPSGLEGVVQGDDHLRLIKSVLKQTFPDATGAGAKAVKYNRGEVGFEPDRTVFDYLNELPHLTDFDEVDVTGVKDCRQALFYANALGKTLVLPAGTYRIASDITITSPLLFRFGAKLKVVDGATVTISSQPMADPRQHIFDWTTGSNYSIQSHVVCTPHWFGAAVDEVTDVQPAFQKWHDSLTSRGGVLKLLGIKYFFAQTFHSTKDYVRIVGEGVLHTTITRSGDFGDTWYFEGTKAGANRNLGLELRDFSMESTALTTTGAHIHITRHTYSRFQNINMMNGFGFLKVESIGQSFFDKLTFISNNLFGGVSTGRYFCWFDEAPTGYTEARNGDTFVSNFNFRSSSNDGSDSVEWCLRIHACDGLWFVNGHLGGGSSALLMVGHDTDTTYIVHGFFVNVMFDGGPDDSYGVVFRGNGNNSLRPFRYFRFVSCSFSGAQQMFQGFRINTAQPGETSDCHVSDVIVSDCNFYMFTQNAVGIYSDACKKISFNNCNMYANSFGNPGDHPNVTIGTNVSGVRLWGGSYGADIDGTGTADTNYGVLVSTGASRIIISGIDFGGNITGGVNNLSASPTVIIEHNLNP